MICICGKEMSLWTRTNISITLANNMLAIDSYDTYEHYSCEKCGYTSEETIMSTCGEISCDQCNDERELLAKAVLKAHRVDSEETNSCLCDACNLAREILQS